MCRNSLGASLSHGLGPLETEPTASNTSAGALIGHLRYPDGGTWLNSLKHGTRRAHHQGCLVHTRTIVLEAGAPKVGALPILAQRRQLRCIWGNGSGDGARYTDGKFVPRSLRGTFRNGASQIVRTSSWAPKQTRSSSPAHAPLERYLTRACRADITDWRGCAPRLRSRDEPARGPH